MIQTATTNLGDGTLPSRWVYKNGKDDARIRFASGGGIRGGNYLQQKKT
jgi:hypothetical protein